MLRLTLCITNSGNRKIAGSCIQKIADARDTKICRLDLRQTPCLAPRCSVCVYYCPSLGLSVFICKNRMTFEYRNVSLSRPEDTGQFSFLSQTLCIVYGIVPTYRYRTTNLRYPHEATKDLRARAHHHGDINPCP